MKEAKSIPNADPLAFIANSKGSKAKPSKVIQEDYDSESLDDDEFISEIRALMVNNPKKNLKKN